MFLNFFDKVIYLSGFNLYIKTILSTDDTLFHSIFSTEKREKKRFYEK
jgi:hypothetical protein